METVTRNVRIKLTKQKKKKTFSTLNIQIAGKIQFYELKCIHSFRISYSNALFI